MIRFFFHLFKFFNYFMIWGVGETESPRAQCLYEFNPLCVIEVWGRERKGGVRRVCSREEVRPSFSRRLLSLFKVTGESGIVSFLVSGGTELVESGFKGSDKVVVLPSRIQWDYPK